MTPAQLAGLTITPPDDSDADFTLSVSATSTEAEGDAATTLANLDVTVTGVADASTVNVVAATGAEDSAIALYIGVALNDVDGSESITDITVSGVPAGAQLSAGTDNLDGTWTLTPADLVGLTVTPPDDSDADFTLPVSATSTEAEGDSATTLANLDVTVTGVADVPTVTVADVTGGEDTAIALDIGVALNDVDGSESITDITVSGVPTGAQLSAGTDNMDGTWTLTPAQLTGLTVTPPADSDGDIFFTDKESHSLLMQPGDGGPLEIVATKAEISAVTGSGGADPKSLAIGPDGAIYLAEDKGDSIVRFDPPSSRTNIAWGWEPVPPPASCAVISRGIAVSSRPTASWTVTTGSSAPPVTVTSRLAIVVAVPPSVSAEVADTDNVKSFVAFGAGVSVMPIKSAGESVQVPSRLSVPAESVAPDGSPAMVMLVMLSEPSTSVRATLMSSGIAVSSPPTASVTVTADASATAVTVTFRLAICEAVPPSASVEVAGSTGEMEVVVSKADLLSLPGVSSVDFDGGMVVSADGTLYAVSDGDPTRSSRSIRQRAFRRLWPAATHFRILMPS